MTKIIRGAVDIVIPMPDVTYTNFIIHTLVPLMQEPSVRQIWMKPGMRSEYAREMLLDDWFKNGSEWVFITDHDMMLPPRALARLLSHKKKMITGLYFGRGEKKYPIIFEPTPLMTWPMVRYFSYPKNALFEVGACGHGCLLINRSIFEKIEKPWSRLGPFEGQDVVGSDVRLCNKARKEADVKIWCDSSVKCGHIRPEPITEEDWIADQETFKEDWDKYQEWKRSQNNG